jgi:PAS domain S-box-containing protein
MRKLSLPSYFLFWISLLVTTSLLVTGYMWLSDNYGYFSDETTHIRETYIIEQKNLVRTQVLGIVDYIDHRRNQAEEDLKSRLKARVYEAHSIAMNLHEQNKGKRPEAEIRKMVKDALRPIRFLNGRGYYFATRLDGLEELFADRPEFEGKDLIDMRDTQGQYVIRDMIDITRNEGEGFYKYKWTKPGTEGRGYPKVAFVKHFEPFDWFIGTGEYLDDFERDIREEVFSRIARIRYGENGYFFIVSYEGFVLVNDTQPDILGKNLWNMTDPGGIKVIQEEVRLAKQPSGGFLDYEWNKPGESTPSPKISFIKGLSDWNMFIGTGVYVDEVERLIALKKNELQSHIKNKSVLTVLVLLALLISSVFISKYISDKIQLNVNTLASYFRDVKEGETASEEDELNVYFPEFEIVSREARKMVSDLKATEASLSESEREYRNLFSSIRDVIIVADKERNIIDANQPALREQFGYELDEVRGKQTSVLYASDEGFNQTGKEIYATDGRSIGKTLEVDFRKRDGSVFPSELSALKLLNEAGEVIGNLGIIRDITERKKDQEKVKESEERLSKISEATFEGIVMSEGGVVIDANPQMASMLGYELPEIIGIEIVKMVAPESHDLVKEKIRLGDTGAYEHKALRKNGVSIDVEVRGKSVSYQGRNVRITAIRDITERKKAEDRHRKREKFLSDILNSVQDGVSILDREFNIVRVNSTMKRLYSHQMPLVGKKCYAAYHGTDRICDPCPSLRTLKEKKTSVDVVPYDTPEGPKGWLELYTFPLFEDGSAEPSGVIEFVRDITPRRQAEEQIKRSLKEKEILLREVHHRVKNNMAIISALLNLQSNYTDDEKIVEMLSESQKRIHAMALVHEKLYQHENFATINFRGYAESLADDLLRSHGKSRKEIKITTDMDDISLSLDTLIPCGLIMNELINNSLKYAFRETPEPEILISLKGKGDMVVLGVRDNGSGLPVDVDLKKSKSLGIKIVNQLIKQLGGKMEIDRSKGTGFEISFSHSDKN